MAIRYGGADWSGGLVRREATFVVTAEGRDAGGAFVLREMGAIPASEWFMRAMQLMARAGTDVPANIFAAGPAGFVTLGLGAFVAGIGKAPWGEVKPLLDDLLGCVVSYQPPGGSVPITRWDVMKTQIEEPATLLMLYQEVVSLHLGFSLRERLLTFRESVREFVSELSQSAPTSTEPPPG